MPIESLLKYPQEDDVLSKARMSPFSSDFVSRIVNIRNPGLLGNENLFNMNRKKDIYSFKAILIESLLKYPCEDNLCDWLGLAHSLPISEVVTFKFAILGCSEMEL